MIAVYSMPFKAFNLRSCRIYPNAFFALREDLQEKCEPEVS
jgi:hypothetical protein